LNELPQQQALLLKTMGYVADAIELSYFYSKSSVCIMLRVGILGLGTVGGGVVKIIRDRKQDFQSILGRELKIVKVMSRRDHRLEELGLSKDIYTDCFDEFLEEDLDIVVEAIGGDVPSETLLKAIKKGCRVVTANKALLADRPRDFMGSENGHHLFFEASCCGGIPIISSFEEGLLSNPISRILGIFNGTCNYILSEMKSKGSAFQDVLKEAQELGYAEADPTFDVEGIDATHKLSLLGSLAFQQHLEFSQIPVSGISQLQPEDFKWAKDNDYTIKLISMAERKGEQVFAGTFPCMIPAEHPLAGVNGANNAVFVQGDYVGDLMFYGAGAGELPTASAVVSDILAAAQERPRNWSHRVFKDAQSADLTQDRKDSFYLRLCTVDQAGVLSKLCSILSKSSISLRFVHQKPIADNQANIVFTTHPTESQAMEKALKEISLSGLLRDETLVMRILDN
jgi:homoserine dehydrogenase